MRLKGGTATRFLSVGHRPGDPSGPPSGGFGWDRRQAIAKPRRLLLTGDRHERPGDANGSRIASAAVSRARNCHQNPPTPLGSALACSFVVIR